MLSAQTFTAMGTTVTVVVAEARALPAAVAAARDEVAAIDRACSRFRDDSELSALNRAAGQGAVAVSPLLGEAVAAALHGARITGGLVDPTVGGCMIDIGYTVTFRDLPADGPPLSVHVRRAPGWECVERGADGGTLRLPEGVSLDLGAVGKAWAADRAAAAAASRCGSGVAVDCGGDVSVLGTPPRGGWPIRVTEHPGAPDWQDVHVFDGGLATSGTTGRRWRRGGREVHHIVDPSTGRSARSPWRMVSVAAASCAEANAAATATIIAGVEAVSWLDGLGLPGRLVAQDGRVLRVGGWPAAA